MKVGIGLLNLCEKYMGEENDVTKNREDGIVLKKDYITSVKLKFM